MEYLTEDDLNHIKDAIDEFIGDTVSGKHLFKAIKVHFKRKDRQERKVIEKRRDFKINTAYPNARIQRIIQQADEALLRFNQKLRSENAVIKSKKKANNKRNGKRNYRNK